ncbi:MAG: LysE family translocator [Thermaurantimonas sp.]|uniref:LysE family translocator n=1 Tax=Thermaurantimonas sp. TaxID=2681568 RepID=UPI00391BBE6A
MVELIIAAVILGITLSFMVGPVFVLLIETSIYSGATKALAFNLGVLLSDIFLIALASYGSEQLLSDITGNNYIYLAGGAIILIYAIFSFVKKQKISVQKIEIQSSYSKNILKGFLINFMNVGVLAYWMTSIVLVGNRYDYQFKKMFMYFSITLGTYFSVDLIKILFARKMRKYLQHSHMQKLNTAVSIILGIFGISLILKGLLLK